MLTSEVEEDFLRTLALIHSKDPRIYEEEAETYEEEDGGLLTLRRKDKEEL